MANWPAAYRQPGVLDYIAKGLDMVTGLANAVQNFRTNRQLRQGRELESVAKQVGLIRSIKPDEDVVIPEDLGGKLEKMGAVKKLTPEMQQQMGETAMQQVFPTKPGSLSTPDMLPQYQSAMQSAMAAAPIGSYVLPAKKSKVGILRRGGGLDVQDVPPGVDKIMAEPTPPVPYGVYDQKTNQFIPTPGRASAVIKPPTPQKPVAIQVGDQVKYFLPTDEGFKEMQGAGGPKFKPTEDTTLIDPTYGIPTGKVPGKIHVLPTPKQDQAGMSTVTESTTTGGGIDMSTGQEAPKTTRTVTKKEKPGAKAKTGFTIKGIGTVQNPPLPGKGKALKNGMKLENTGNAFILVHPDGRRQTLTGDDVE